MFSKKSGLCSVSAYTNFFETNIYGTDVINKFNSIEESLKSKYGRNLKIDRLNDESLLNKDEDWTSSLANNERRLISYWSKDAKSELSDKIESISLEAHGIHPKKAHISISYLFDNFYECKANFVEMNSDGL